MKARYIPVLILIGSITTCTLQNSKIADLEGRRGQITAQYEQQTSTVNLIGSAIKSFFDGYTFGAFAEEGMLTESNKWSRMNNDYRQQMSSTRSATDQAISTRRWSILWATFAIIWMLRAYRRKGKGSDPEQNPTPAGNS
jgi:hypothetical protein